jgi:hypothetical protein
MVMTPTSLGRQMKFQFCECHDLEDWVGLGLRIVGVSRSHSGTYIHTREDFSERVISPSHRSLPDNTLIPHWKLCPTLVSWYHTGNCVQLWCPHNTLDTVSNSGVLIQHWTLCPNIVSRYHTKHCVQLWCSDTTLDTVSKFSVLIPHWKLCPTLVSWYHTGHCVQI